jgi:hypothetical protein
MTPSATALDTPETVTEASVKAEHPWQALGSEHFQLMRLNALPADRETGLRPLRFVSLGRVERHSETESFLRLVVSLPGQNTHKEVNTLDVWADHKQQQIRINTDFPLRCEPANRGLGRFLLAQAVLWARKRWNHYTVASQALLIKHAANDAARLRRDHALQAQGFSVTYEDAVQMRAVCSVGRVSQLHSDWNDNKVCMIDTLDSATMLQNADQNLHEQSAQIKKLNERIDRLKSEDSTLRFTISMLAIFAVFQAALLIWIATR